MAGGLPGHGRGQGAVGRDLSKASSPPEGLCNKLNAGLQACDKGAHGHSPGPPVAGLCRSRPPPTRASPAG